MRNKTVLICAWKMPEFDREGGSRRVFHLIEFFQQAGWKVYFAANVARDGQRYASLLQQIGVVVYTLQSAWPGGDGSLITMEELLALESFDLAVFVFWDCAERYIPIVRSVSPETVVVTDSIDLHFVRQARRAFTKTEAEPVPGTLDMDYAEGMTRELNTYAASDAVLTVSQKEADTVNDLLGRTAALPLPQADDIERSEVPYQNRRGILFIGNFRHPPNVQAVEYLCKEVLPLIPENVLADHPLYIVGNEPNDVVMACARSAKHVRLVGWVPSVQPYLHHARISVAPLLYGAGTKTKLMQSLMAGTPVVSTPIGIEGFDIKDGQHVLVAGSAEQFAQHIQELLKNESLWNRVSKDGADLMRQMHGKEAIFRRFRDVVSQIQDQSRL